jgi:hypothetical protein
MSADTMGKQRGNRIRCSRRRESWELTAGPLFVRLSVCSSVYIRVIYRRARICFSGVGGSLGGITDRWQPPPIPHNGCCVNTVSRTQTTDACLFLGSKRTHP